MLFFKFSIFLQIDGFEQDKKVVVIAATNRKQDLDPALIRYWLMSSCSRGCGCFLCNDSSVLMSIQPV